MYLRFVRVKIDQRRIHDVQSFYQSEILPALEETAGCRLASLLQSTSRPGECLSMTLWESHEGADTWEKSGRFRTLVDKGSYLLTGTAGWGGALTGSSQPEAATRAFTIEAGESTLEKEDFSSRLFLRATSIRVREGRWDELVELYDQEVVPTLLSSKGCRAAFLVEGLNDPDLGLSLSIWDTEEHATRYEISGKFDTLTRKLKTTLTTTSQWQPAYTSDGISEGNPPTEGYRIVVSRRL